jgi:hypothetical protein
MSIDDKKAQDGWVKGGGVTIAAEEVLLELKLGGGEEFLADLLTRKVAVALAIRKQITLSDDEVDDALATFYSDRDLFEDAQITAWLASMLLDEASVRGYVRETAFMARARTTLINDDAINDRFASDRYDYTTAEVEVFKFASAGEAKEFMLAVREKEAQATDGEQRRMTRREAPEEIAAALFACEAGDLVGPVENEDDEHEVFVLRSRTEAELDDELRVQIRDEMFRQLIETELTRDPAKFLK